MHHLLCEVEESQRNEAMKNEKKLIKDRDHKNVEALFDGVNDTTWKQGSKETIDHAMRLPLVLRKSHSEMNGNDLVSLLDNFTDDHSSHTARAACSMWNGWSFFLVCSTQKHT